jgi:hypothetical protein
VLGLAALVLAAASVDASSSITSVSPWWERITWTFSGDGAQQSCKFESSLDGRTACDSEKESGPTISGGNGTAGSFTKITVERRFTPAGRPDRVSLESGDVMLGGQIIALAIDANGAVRSCRIIGASGDVQPPYGCREARAERFEASVSTELREVRKAFMTVVVYGHEEYLA